MHPDFIFGMSAEADVLALQVGLHWQLQNSPRRSTLPTMLRLRQILNYDLAHMESGQVLHGKNNFKMLKPLVVEALNSITAANWTSAVRHTEELQIEDAKNDIAIEHYIEYFVINIEDSCSGESSDEN